MHVLWVMVGSLKSILRAVGSPGIIWGRGLILIQSFRITQNPITYIFFSYHYFRDLKMAVIFSFETPSPTPNPSLSYGYFTSFYPEDLWMIFKMSF